MNKQRRQYIGILAALISYYVLHEGAHLIYACSIGVFENIRFMGLGIQIVADTQHMSDAQLGMFCLVGSIATIIAGYILVFATSSVCRVRSKVFKSCMYYITLAMLLIDPLYLSVLCGFFGGGDLNGIGLLLPEWMARTGYGVILLIHAILFLKILLPKYKTAFAKIEGETL